ncbi:hypothetical protein ASPVEDRAFT_146150 [Aspergillus versicolor CBS 583.65]|uniref:Chitin-binding type-2 domain-containing protein n=1 Tax=Aspergillus versicolor CBS 583.65 TaxID=1036611 RepID=A0A1L9P5C1_ASPVE|nr:uncharacterized protein ASPVEDRAFT_146150 [Aspergillus versicolor CBS 583.65]OJI96692.1 hypothetical protein ASPVEDRAFT_146150 [Aspergillus versicolor CBS 583.65]
MKSFFLTCTLLASSALGHIQMSKPYPIRSPLNQKAEGQKDYSYTNPLSTSGDDFPCKGYANDPFKSVADYKPGQEYEIELQGSATHNGGSCQISLSYDKGKTFRVIHSMIGGCPLEKSYKFKVPSDAPSGEALLAWTWFNKVGNREMYMNCAQVTVGSDNARMEGFSAVSKANAFDSLPEIFVANVNGPGKCVTIEGKDVNFPQPGPSVEGKAEEKGYKCEGSAPFLGSSRTTNDNAASSSSAAASPSASAARAAHGALDSSPAAASSSAAVAHAPLGQEASAGHYDYPTPEHRHCRYPDEYICSADHFSFFRCVHGDLVFMGPVAPGTWCVNGHIERAPWF